jgi:hypothetical protein
MSKWQTPSQAWLPSVTDRLSPAAYLQSNSSYPRRSSLNLKPWSYQKLHVELPTSSPLESSIRCQISQFQRNGAVPPFSRALRVHQPRAHFSVSAIGRRAGARSSHHGSHCCRCMGCCHCYKAIWLEEPRDKMM